MISAFPKREKIKRNMCPMVIIPFSFSLKKSVPFLGVGISRETGFVAQRRSATQSQCCSPFLWTAKHFKRQKT